MSVMLCPSFSRRALKVTEANYRKSQSQVHYDLASDPVHSKFIAN